MISRPSSCLWLASTPETSETSEAHLSEAPLSLLSALGQPEARLAPSTMRSFHRSSPATRTPTYNEAAFAHPSVQKRTAFLKMFPFCDILARASDRPGGEPYSSLSIPSLLLSPHRLCSSVIRSASTYLRRTFSKRGQNAAEVSIHTIVRAPFR